MARKKSPEKAPNHERWLVSYADFITLLFAVFVTLYAMSQTDRKKVEEVAASYRSAFGVTVGPPPGPMEILRKTDTAILPSAHTQARSSSKERQPGDAGQETFDHLADTLNIIEHLKENISDYAKDQNSVEIGMTKKGLVIRLLESGMFEPGHAEIKHEMYPLLIRIADILQPYHTFLSFEGHTDNRPVNSQKFQSNWELSIARATSVAEYFLSREDFAPEKVSISGFSQYHPLADNHTEEGRKRNRRVDIVLPAIQSGSGSPLLK